MDVIFIVPPLIELNPVHRFHDNHSMLKINAKEMMELCAETMRCKGVARESLWCRLPSLPFPFGRLGSLHHKGFRRRVAMETPRAESKAPVS
jgi:hypothetical protein